MDSIGKNLRTSLARAGVVRQVEAAQVIEIATSALQTVFADESRHVRPQYVKNRTLTVTCDSASFAQKLKSEEQKIVALLNHQLPENAKVERIRYLL